MRHQQIQESLHDWLDGELEPAASAEVALHAGACPACGNEALRLRALRAALYGGSAAGESSAEPRGVEAFVSRVMARVEADAVSSWERFAARFLAPAFGLALAGLILAISLPAADEDAPLGVAMSVDADFVLGVRP